MTLGILTARFRVRPVFGSMLACALVLLVGLTAPGCIHHPKISSPALPLTEREARELTRDLELGRPVPMTRPVVVLAAYHSPGINEARIVRRLKKYTSDDRRDFLVVTYTSRVDFERMADRAIRLVQQNWPSDDPEWTTEVDVIGVSMGGLVGRYAAMDPMEGGVRNSTRKLNINRMFTIATPHRGAQHAESVLAPDRAARDMRADSEFLAYLDSGLDDAHYTIVPYARLQDDTLGPPERGAPHGADPIWVSGPWFGSHFGSARDERILLDIALRLRGEPPLGSPEPPPDPAQFQPITGAGGYFLDEQPKSGRTRFGLGAR